jgi:hypothetical protein
MQKDNAVDQLIHTDRDTLVQWCKDSHKDMYGYGGYHLEQYTVCELVSWIIANHRWDSKLDIWIPSAHEEINGISSEEIDSYIQWSNQHCFESL